MATSTSSSAAIIAFSKALRWAIALALLAAVVIFVRRWAHHAQLELVPVIVPDVADANDTVRPPPYVVFVRMIQDVRDLAAAPQRPRLAVLTFDDGPYPVTTPVLVAQLRALHVPAEFFLIGNDAARQPAISAAVAAAGIDIGNHTLTHPELTTLTAAAQQDEVRNGAAAIFAVTGRSATYFRPPHGNYNADTIRAARTARETMVLWDVDPGDWRTLTPEQIAALVGAQAKAPALILLHNGKDATIEALPQIVKAYRDAGFTFVSLAELQRRVPLDDINTPIAVHL
ncbi:MAG TPA: polysaccharide deacetylase family protein [Candidatus Eremiobacteraceae bacterium]